MFLRAASSQPVLLSLADEGSWLVPMEDPDGRFRAAEPARVANALARVWRL